MINYIYDTLLKTCRATSEGQLPVLVGDIYDLNKIDAEQPFQYPMFILTRGKSTVDLRNEKIIYDFTLYYVDRTDTESTYNTPKDLTSELPKIYNYPEYVQQVVSDEGAEQILVTFLRILDEATSLFQTNMELSQYELVPFKEKFNDICAGAYVTFKLTKRITDCDFLNVVKMM